MYRTGGNSYYTQEKVILVQGSGKVEVVKNTVVPDPEIAGTRPGMNSLQTFLSTFLIIKKGEIKSSVSYDAIVKRFRRDRMVFKPYGMARVLSTVIDCATHVPVLKKIMQDQETVTSERLVSLIRVILKSIPANIYYYIHTQVVFDFLNCFSQVQGKYTLGRLAKRGLPLVPDNAFHIVKESECVGDLTKDIFQEILDMESYPVVALYLGGLSTFITTPIVEGITTAIASMQLSNQTRGSEKTALSIMSAMVGYSGVTTEHVKTIQRAVAMVGGVIKSGIYKIDIELASLGDMSMLHNSLSSHFPAADWAFHIMANQLTNVESAYRYRVTTERRKGAHLVRYEKTDIKSHTTKDKSADKVLLSVSKETYQSESGDWQPSDEYTGYTVYTAVFGYYPWAGPGESLQGTRFFSELRAPQKKHYVYGFGLGDKFYGIISTIPTYALFGKVVTKIHTDRAPILADAAVPLPCIISEMDWYRRVVQHNCLREVYWAIARPQFSPISNVVVVPKSGIAVEDGDFGPEWRPVSVGAFDELPIDVSQEDYEILGEPTRAPLITLKHAPIETTALSSTTSTDGSDSPKTLITEKGSHRRDKARRRDRENVADPVSDNEESPQDEEGDSEDDEKGLLMTSLFDFE